MESSGDFILEYLPTPQITLKSQPTVPILMLSCDADLFVRIIVAAIRNRGRCPCPRCLIPMERLQNMGMGLDMVQRESLSRVDDIKRRVKVTSARNIIYEKNYAVDGDAVETILKEQTLVPTLVSCRYARCFNN